MKIADLKIGTRMGAGIAIILILLVIVGGIGFKSLQDISSAYALRVDRANRAMLSVELAGLVDVASEMTIASLRVDDEAEVKRLLDKSGATTKRALEILKTLHVGASAEGEAVVNEVEKAALPFRAAKSAAATLKADPSKAGQLDEFITKELAPAARNYTAIVGEYTSKAQAAAKDAGDQAAAVANEARTWLLTFGAVALVIGVLIGWLLTRSITRPIARAVKVAGVIASGDLTQRIDVDGKDETGQLLAALSTMNGSLANTVGQIRNEAEAMRGDAERIAQSVNQVTTAAAQQSEATSSMAAAVEELTVSVSHISDAANQTQLNSENVTEKCVGGEAEVVNAADSMKRIASAITAASEKIRGLEARATQINAAASAIKEIADQTNLLALNAAIEAARAGEQGRGFSVVADEVRKLAERTASATVEIEEMVSAVQRETSESTTQMDHVLPLVQAGTQQADQVAVSLREISTSAQASLERVREVAHATKEQSSASTSIAQQVESIAQMVEETTAAMKSTAQSAEEMSEMAKRLNELVRQFKV